jgi:hypothetical protein
MLRRELYLPVPADASGRHAETAPSIAGPWSIVLCLSAVVAVLYYMRAGAGSLQSTPQPRAIRDLPQRPTDISERLGRQPGTLHSAASSRAQPVVTAAGGAAAAAPRAPPADCGGETSAECSAAVLVRHYAVEDTVIVSFGNARQRHFTSNWVYHLQRSGVNTGILVGMMNTLPHDPLYRPFASHLRARGVGVYCVNSAEVRLSPQGGRWFHVLPLLRTGVRLILSDSDVAWLRDPAPYLRALEAEHPRMDFAVSTDAQAGTDHRRLGGTSDLDVEAWGQCHASMNIGIMLFPPGMRKGTLLAMEETTAHLSQDGNLRRVDQGPINYRWKYGYRSFKWPRPLFRVEDGTGGRLCGLSGGNVTGAVLPAAQFCNTLTHDVLQLWRSAGVSPFAVHATWMRRQDEPWKVMRMREQALWHDDARWYGHTHALREDASSWMVPDGGMHAADRAALSEQVAGVRTLPPQAAPGSDAQRCLDCA